MPNPFVKRAKRNTLQKVHIYIGPIECIVFLQAYLFLTLRISSGFFRLVFLVPFFFVSPCKHCKSGLMTMLMSLLPLRHGPMKAIVACNAQCGPRAEECTIW